MGLIRRSNGFYYVRNIRNGILKTFSLKTKNKQVATELYQAFLIHQMRPKYFSSEGYPFDQIHVESNQDIKMIQQRSKNSYDNTWVEYFETNTLNRLSKSQLGIKKQVFNHLKMFNLKKMDEIDQSFLNKVFENYQTKYKDDSIRKYITEIKTFLHYCIKNDLFSESDYKKLSFIKTIARVDDTVISDEDMKKIMDYLKENEMDFYVYMLNLINLFGRPNEIPFVQKKNFDFDKGICSVWMNKTKRFKKVLLTDKGFIEFMKEYTKDLQDNDFILKGHTQGPEYYGKKFKKIKIKLNLNMDYSLYTVRHTVGTKLYKQTKDVKFVGNQLGDQVETILRHYVNIDMEYYKQYVDI